MALRWSYTEDSDLITSIYINYCDWTPLRASCGYLPPAKKRSKKLTKPLDLSALRVILSLDDKDFKELRDENK